VIGSNGSIFDDQATVILLILSGCFEFFQVAGLYCNRWLFSLLNIHEVIKNLIVGFEIDISPVSH